MTKKEKMIAEAVKRLELMDVEEEDIKLYKENQEIPCYFVNHEERKIGKTSLTKEQKKIIEEVERDRKEIVYYAIIDNGIWPDGAEFERWSFLTVSGYENDWVIQKENSITKFGCVPAYIYNCEEPDCSEEAEMPFRNMNGIIINIS